MKHPGQRYFHILEDEDLNDLRELLRLIRDRRGEVISRWYELYLRHFGDERSLSEADFRRIFEPALLRNKEALMRKDMAAYVAGILQLGKELAQFGMPLDELIAALELFEEVAQTVLPPQLPCGTAVYSKFGKLSHIRIILLMSGYSGLQSAVAAMRIGAQELNGLKVSPDRRDRFLGLIGQTPVMRRLYASIEAAAGNPAPILIVGEKGSGKELAARAVHECAARQGPFVALRCEPVPAYLIEGELFGYRRPGGGSPSYVGFYGAARGGTLFLDQICSLPADVQEQLVRRVEAGGAAARIIAASSREPEEALRVGQLRDNFCKLFGCRLRMPPLRERAADIPLLARHFIDLLNQRMSRETPIGGIDNAALALMQRYAWPGNVEELSGTIENAFASARSEIIGAADLPSTISGVQGRGKNLPAISFETFADAERGVLQRALEISGGNKVRAARLLKISRKKLYSGIAKYGLKSAQL